MPITKRACTVASNSRWKKTKVTVEMYEIIVVHLRNVFFPLSEKDFNSPMLIVPFCSRSKTRKHSRKSTADFDFLDSIRADMDWSEMDDCVLLTG